FEQEAAQASAARDGLVEQPVNVDRAPLGKHTADALNGPPRFIDLPVGAVDTRQIADAAIACAYEQAAGQRGLDRDEQVIPVDEELAARDLLGAEAFDGACGPVGVGAGRRLHGLALAQGQLEAVAYERG